MNDLIYSIAQTFVSKEIKYKNFISNFHYLLNGFDDDSRSKLRLLIKLVNIFSYIRYFKGFKNLSTANRNNILKIMYHAPIGKIRAGITGLRSLNLLAFYSLEENYQLIGYKIDTEANN